MRGPHIFNNYVLTPPPHDILDIHQTLLWGCRSTEEPGCHIWKLFGVNCPMNLYGYQLGSHIQEGGTAQRAEGRIHKNVRRRRPTDCGTRALSWEDRELKLSLAV